MKTTEVIEKIIKYFTLALSVGICVYHIYTAGFGTLSTMNHRLIHWMSIFTLIFIIYPGKNRITRILDLILILMVLFSGVYLIISWRSITLIGVGARTPIEILLAIFAIVTTVEGTRRAIGWVLPITAGVFMLYLLLGPLLPPAIGHHGYSLNRIATILYYGNEGIFGVPIGVSATMIIVFVIFGALLNTSGGGRFFIDLAFSFAGRARGGSAKTAIISSALLGSISGSPIANVVTTGTFTIPLMKKDGYKSHVAGAVEAIASTGGQIMPPIMGAGAFLMAEYIGVPYAKIALSALIPALIYFISIYIIIDIEAIKNMIKGRPSCELPQRWNTLKRGWYLLLPLLVLIFFLFFGYSVTKSVYYSIIIILIVWFVQLKFNIRILLEGFMRAAAGAIRSAAPVVSACACAGIVVGIIQLTGLGLRISSLITTISGGSLFIALLFAMIASLTLGMGLPTTVLYIVLATLVAPTLISLGTPVLPAHLFVFYFGCMSSITPPVALASYGASPIAESSAIKIGLTAFRYSIVAYIIPFMIIYSPALILVGSPVKVVLSVVTSLVGTACLAFAIQNWLLVKTMFTNRIALGIAALLFIQQGLKTDLIALLIFSIVISIQYFLKKKSLSLNGAC